jgi:MFS family permease
MTLLYRAIPPHIYVSLCVLSWGLIASLQSVATSFSSMLLLRALLGVAEAAFGPGVPFYLSFFYKPSELAYRVGLFISAAPLATSCASTLAWLIVKLSQNGRIEPWRMLFLAEGFPGIIVAVFAWYIIPDSPSTASYLTPREREIAKLRLEPLGESVARLSRIDHQHGRKRRRHNHGLSLADLLATLSDPKSYLTALMFFSANVAFSSLPVFLPTIIRSMSFSTLMSELLSAPPFLLSFIFVLVVGRVSDRTPNSRGIAIIAVSLLSSASYAMIATIGSLEKAGLLHPTASRLIRYAAVYTATMGFFASVTLIITWTLNNQPTVTGKGTGMALLNVIGQCGPLVGTHLYPDRDGPLYVPGMTICAVFMLAVAVLALGLRWWLGVLNFRATDPQSVRHILLPQEPDLELDDVTGEESGSETETDTTATTATTTAAGLLETQSPQHQPQSRRRHQPRRRRRTSHPTSRSIASQSHFTYIL